MAVTAPTTSRAGIWWRATFATRLAVIALVGFGVRVGYAVGALRDDGTAGDAVYYAAQAETIADGKWFEHLFQPGTPAADHPPLNSLVLSVPARFFRGNVMAMRITEALVGVATIVLVGVLARLVARRSTTLNADRVGLIAAALTAVYANFWMNDVIMMAEAVTAACVAATMVATYLFIERPSARRAAMVGALVGLSALARAEMALLGLIVAVPAVVLTTRDWRLRAARTGACAAAALLVVSPWVVRNLIRFDEPTFLSTGAGHVIAGANCPGTYYGDIIGAWDFDCGFFEPDAPQGLDQSELSAWYGDRGKHYRNDHLGRLPVVVAARVARLWSVGWIGQMARANTLEGRKEWASDLGVASFWVLVPLAVGGAVLARRLRLVSWPLLTLPVLVTGVAAWYYGLVRFRLPAEITLVVFAAIAITVLWDRRQSATLSAEDA